MGSDLQSPLAIFPLVEEDEATGRVAAIYARLLDRSRFVPSLFKSLAVCPPYLQLAWRQAEPALDGDELQAAAVELADSVGDAATPPSEPDAAKLLGGFVEPLGRMTLLSCGLLAALEGELSAPSAGLREPPRPPDEPLPRDVPTAWEVDSARAFGRIRAALDTPIINTVWRVAAGEGLLDVAWEHLEPQAAVTRERAERLREAAIEKARRLEWKTAVDRGALEVAGIEEAAPGIEAILDAYVKTLPRVLTLLAGCRAA